MKKTKSKYWYYITEYECVLCGHIDKYQERCYTEKPEEYTDRHLLRETACSEHFVSNNG